MFDAARLLAAYSIVWLHTPRSEGLAHWSLLGRFAVPFFSAAAVFFVVDGLRRNPDRSLREYTANRLRRIYVPFLAWSAIYLVFKWIKEIAAPEQANVFPGIEALWTGTFFHLWFMPFVLVATLATFVVARRIIGNRAREMKACVALGLAGLAIAVVQPPSIVAADTGFLLLAWQTLPAVCWGIAVAMVYGNGLQRISSSAIVRASNKMISEKGTVPFCSADSAKSGQSSIIMLDAVSRFSAAAFIIAMGLLCAVGRNTLLENVAGMLLLVAALARGRRSGSCASASSDRWRTEFTCAICW